MHHIEDCLARERVRRRRSDSIVKAGRRPAIWAPHGREGAELLAFIESVTRALFKSSFLVHIPVAEYGRRGSTR